MPAIPTDRPSSPTPASRGPWLALLLIVVGILVANRRPIADAVAGPLAGRLAPLLGGWPTHPRDAWPVVPAPGPMVILGPAAPAGVGIHLDGGSDGGGRLAGGEGWGPGEVGD